MKPPRFPSQGIQAELVEECYSPAQYDASQQKAFSIYAKISNLLPAQRGHVCARWKVQKDNNQFFGFVFEDEKLRKLIHAQNGTQSLGDDFEHFARIDNKYGGVLLCKRKHLKHLKKRK